MDTVFFSIIVVILIILLIPLENIKSFKAAGIEVSLEQPQVQSAIMGLGLQHIENERLRNNLLRQGDNLKYIQGSRVLWIDDYPNKVVKERRLLRALGVGIVVASSSEDAENILNTDNDFDLIITDIQRKGTTHLETGGVDIHEGVNFIVKIRESHPDPFVKTLPVIFYAAYPDRFRLIGFTQAARKFSAEAEVANAPADFILKVVRLLSDARSVPIESADTKFPTIAR